MLTTYGQKRSLRRVLTAPFSMFLSVFMSNHTKRLFYFASLYASMVPLEHLKCDVMGKLNAAMQLARSDEALMLPASFSRVVWGHDDVVGILKSTEPTRGQSNEEAIRLRAFMLVRMASKWMRFGNVDEMRSETERFLKCIDNQPVMA